MTRSRATAAEIEFQLKPIGSIAQVEGLWRDLEKRGESSFFTSWTWIGSWLEALPARVRPLVLTANRGTTVVGAAIAVVHERRRLVWHLRQLYFNATGNPEFDGITIEHNDFIGPTGPGGALWPAFMRWFVAQTDFDELIVPGVRRGSLEQRFFPGGLLSDETVFPAYATSLPATGGREAILSGLSSNARQQLRRNLRAAEGLGAIACERAETVETALSWFKALKQFHVESWARRGKPHAFRYPFFEAFHRNLIARGVPEGSVDMLRVSAGGVPFGYLYNFRKGDCAIAYQSGFDYARSDQRPGYLCHLLAMEFAARRGLRRYDFLAGENQLKRTFANDSYAMLSRRFSRRSLRANFEHSARSAIGKLRVRHKIKEPARGAGS